MPEQIPLTLTRQELDQLLEALDERAESWERTAEALRASRSGTSEVGSPGGAGHASYRQRSEVRPGDAMLQGSEDGAPEDCSDEVLENRRFCMQSSLAGLTTLQIAARCRKVMDKILGQSGI